MAFTHLQTWKTNYVKSGTGSPESPIDYQGEIRVYYEQDIPNNRTRIKINHYVYIWLASGYSFCFIDGYTIKSNYRANKGSFGGTYQSVTKRWDGGPTYTSSQYVPLVDYTSGSYSTYYWINHDADGTAKLYVNGQLECLGLPQRTSSFIKDLPTIPRYAIITAYTLMPVDFSTLRVNWSANVTCDQVQYRIGSGSWVTAQTGDRTSGSFNITGLNPGTQYSIKIRVRRKDSQLYTESSTKSATTTDIARITNQSVNFDIDNGITVNFTNPSGLKVDVWIEGIDKIGGTAQYGLPFRESVSSPFVYSLTQAEKDILFNNNPTRDKFPIRIAIRTANNNNYVTWKDGYASISNANPTFDNFTFADINSQTTDLTGNNQTIIKGYSTLRAIISTSNKAVAQKGATMDKYRLVVGSKQIDVDYSDSSDVNLELENIDNNVFIVYAIDSRGNSTTKQISPTEYIAYSKVVLSNGQAERTGGIGDETTLKFNGTFYNVDFGSSSNSLTITYKYKKTSLPDLEENWVDGTTTITPSITDNNFSFENIIAGDKGALGFDSNYSYNIKIIATDKLSSDEYDLILGTGKPNMAIHRKGTAFGAPYDEELEGFQIVDKKITFNGLELFKWVEEEEE